MKLITLTIILLTASLAVANPDCATLAIFNETAEKALAGKFGKLAEWQRVGYQEGADLVGNADRVQVRRAWITTYYPQEGFTGNGNTGYKVSLRMAAANLLPSFTFVFVPKPTHLRQILDCGAHYNDRVARADPNTWVPIPGGRVKGKGCDFWLDLWVPRPYWKGVDTHSQDVVVIRRG